MRMNWELKFQEMLAVLQGQLLNWNMIWKFLFMIYIMEWCYQVEMMQLIRLLK